MIYNDDALIVLKKLEVNSIDACITDPPYGLHFMGKEWDRLGDKSANFTNLNKPHKSQENYPMNKGRGRPISETDGAKQQEWHYQWAKEVLRVLKPGGHLLSFGGSRTYHRMACAIEDAGFEIRDQIMWVYGSGFPKSLNIGKVMDKFLKTGNASWNGTGDSSNGALGYSKLQHKQDYRPEDYSNRHQNKSEITEEKAKEWEGYGTALKPAHEPIVLARKPLSEKTVAQNVLKWGVGGLAIDNCRVGTETTKTTIKDLSQAHGNQFGKIGIKYPTQGYKQNPVGRFPSNLIHDGSQEVMDLFPETKSGELKPGHKRPFNFFRDGKDGIIRGTYGGDSGSAARFFYTAKASKRERDMGCGDMEEKIKKENMLNSKWNTDPRSKTGYENKPEIKARNNHPTVKPLALMKYLVTLITREGQTVLDPFMGSGTTGMACKELKREFVGIEKEKEYCDIAEKRIKAMEEYEKTTT